MTTIVNQLQTLHEQVPQPYRALCTAAMLPYPTFMRWNGRVRRGAPPLRKPGPKPVGELNLAGLQAQLRELEHGPRRSHGTTALYAEHRSQISRRAFQRLLEETRREVLRERQADQRRIDWRVPGTVWSVDPTELVIGGAGVRQKHWLLPVLDLASRYKLRPLLSPQLTGEIVAARLDELFQRHGAPLVLKRDNGSNLNCEAVNEVLSRWLVIPLNSPPHYPPYNGSIERSQRDLKSVLRPELPVEAPGEVRGLVAENVHELNHRPRRCLRGHNACEQFAGAKLNLRGYTRRVRKEAIQRISALAMKIMLELPAHSQGHADAAWRRAVETWLQEQGIITIHEPRGVTQFS